MFCNQAVQALSFREDTILPKYGYYFLHNQQPLLAQLAKKVSIDILSKEKWQSVLIRFPPIPVQEKMVAQMCLPEILSNKAEQLEMFLKKYLLLTTIQAAEGIRTYTPIGDLLAEQPLTGLRAKASLTGNGVAMVSKLSKDNSRLAELEACCGCRFRKCSSAATVCARWTSCFVA